MAISVADNFLYQGKKPLDSRVQFNTLTDMKNMPAAVIYDGLLAYVKTEKKYYTYDTTNTVDPTLGKWRELETGGGVGGSVEGYFNPADNLFYEESTYTTAITGESGFIYVSLDTNKTYRFNGTIFVRLDDEETNIQVDTMPTASADNVNTIVQYIGVTDSTYTNGYFYQCAEDPDNVGTYIWTAKSVQAGGSGSLGKAITAAIDVGGIDAGDSFAVGTSYDDMFDALLNPTLYPTFTAPSASLAGTGSKTLEAGSTLTVTLTATFNRGTITPAYGTNGYRSGAATDYALNGGTAQVGNTFSQTVSESNASFKVRVNHSAGEQPKDSKGNNYDSPYPAGYKETNTVTYVFADCIWANTANIATVAKLAVVAKSTGQKDLTFPAQTVANPETFDIPASWNVTAVQVKNDLSGQWEDAASQFIVTTTTHDNAAGTSVNYNRYTFNLGYPTGSRQVRVKWN